MKAWRQWSLTAGSGGPTDRERELAACGDTEYTGCDPSSLLGGGGNMLDSAES